MPEQVGTPTMHFPDVPWDKACGSWLSGTPALSMQYILKKVYCGGGMGATNFIFMASTDFRQ